jgi:hypothetical protein
MSIFAIEKFDANEWYLVIGTVIVYTVMYLLPKRLPASSTLLLCIWSFTVSMFYDFTIGGGLIDYYDVNDSPDYCLMDLVSYFFYAPFGYFVVYFYERLGITRRSCIWYLLAWALIAIANEWVMDTFRVIIYKNGYTIYASFIIYLFTLSATMMFYRWLTSPGKQEPAPRPRNK